jgi:hypothetical protein
MNFQSVKTLFPSVLTDGKRVLLVFSDQSKQGRATLDGTNQASLELAYAHEHYRGSNFETFC